MKKNVNETPSQALGRTLRRESRSQFFIAASVITLMFVLMCGTVYLYFRQPDALFRFNPKRGDVLQTSTTTIHSIEVPSVPAVGGALPDIIVHLSLLGREIGIHQPWKAQAYLRAGRRVRITYWIVGSEVVVSKIEPADKAPSDFRKPE